MKFNQWTLGLAAVGAVSLASAVRADEAKLSALNTALSNTTISGYVDAAAQYNLGAQSAGSAQAFGVAGSKKDAISVNNVTISLDKPMDESPWASGYHVDLNGGTDAITPLNANAGNFGIRQAYIALRTPVGNGIDWKLGLFDGITGYESNTSYLNPNYTRSYGYQVNPASAAGLIGTYKVINEISVTAGIANRGQTFGAGLLPAGQSNTGQFFASKDFIFAAALTAPDSWGFLKGSTLNVGTFQGFDNGAVNNYSVSATLNTPVTGLKFGLSYDAVQSLTQATPASDLSYDGNIYGVYATYQATAKLNLSLRYEYVDISGVTKPSNWASNLQEITATVQYDLWANVVSRLEFRWDTTEHGVGLDQTGAFPARNNGFLAALNVVYKF
ncbi:MAG: outer membrane beta-barrel protein [Verrucomicrobiota bacterium]